MKKIVLPILVSFALASCNKKTETTMNNTDSSGVFVDTESAADSTLAVTTSCYMQVTGNDTLFAQIDDNLGTVTGKMHYKNYQKDSSFGDLLGSSIGDTIKVDYTFQSEGTLSTRELWFLKKDGKLIEGIGDYDKTGERYTNYKKIKFEDGHILDAVDCKTIANKFPAFTVTSGDTPVSSEPQPVAAPKEEAKPAEKPKEEPKKEEAKPAEKTTKTTQKTAETKKAETKTTAKTTEAKKK